MAYFGFSFIPLWAIEPTPPFKKVACLKHLGQRLEHLAVAVAFDDAAVLVLDLGPPLDDLFDDHIYGWQNVGRFKTGDDKRLAVFVGADARNTLIAVNTDRLEFLSYTSIRKSTQVLLNIYVFLIANCCISTIYYSRTLL